MVEGGCDGGGVGDGDGSVVVGLDGAPNSSLLVEFS